MGRKLEFDKDDVLEKAMKSFWENGYEATSLEDLLKAMSISKGSFYHCFENKETLFKKCLSHYRNFISQDMLNNLQNAPSGLIFIESVFNDAIHHSKSANEQMGCFVMNSAREFAQKDTLVAQLVQDGMNQLEHVFLMALERAQREGALAEDRDTKSLAQYLLSSLNGVKTMVQAGTRQEALENIVKTTLLSLK